MDVNTVVQRRDEHIFTRLDDELLALDPHRACCYALGGAAPRVWELISSPTPIGTMRDTLMAEYDVDEATCLADLLALVDQLGAAGLVEVTG